jgi:hypothetical protein
MTSYHKQATGEEARQLVHLARQLSGDARQCDLCGGPYVGQSKLVGICHQCCSTLGGGRHSCKGIQQEARAIAARRPKA